jgi:hypothetical protein
MIKISSMIDMALTPKEEENENGSVGILPPTQRPRYPYGLSISLTDAELDKLSMSKDVGVGDMMHIHAMGKVTSVSVNDTEGGQTCRVEMQITHMMGEDEDEENQEADSVPVAKRRQRLYG